MDQQNPYQQQEASAQGQQPMQGDMSWMANMTPEMLQMMQQMAAMAQAQQGQAPQAAGQAGPQPAGGQPQFAQSQAAPAFVEPSAEQRNAQALLEAVADNVEKVIVGKRESVELVVMSLVAKGHVLLEDMPGTGKTTLVSALAKSIDCSFSRIQFTPDVMPSDVTGFSIFNQKTQDFEFRAGAIMSNLVLADEINRASAKTQSAMLEAMEERQVTVDGVTYKLAEPFMVMATQNPIEQYGTYPLPEAQLDRFLIKISMGYLKMDEEVRAVLEADDAKAALEPVASAEDILALREAAKGIHVAPAVARYAVQITAATREAKECSFGASPRGSKSIIALARAHALLRGRTYVSPDDVKYLAPFCLCHRIALTHEAKMDGRTPRDVVASLLDSVAVPVLTADEAGRL